MAPQASGFRQHMGTLPIPRVTPRAPAAHMRIKRAVASTQATSTELRWTRGATTTTIIFFFFRTFGLWRKLAAYGKVRGMLEPSNPLCFQNAVSSPGFPACKFPCLICVMVVGKGSSFADVFGTALAMAMVSVLCCSVGNACEHVVPHD